MTEASQAQIIKAEALALKTKETQKMQRSVKALQGLQLPKQIQNSVC